ncbi:MAG: septal ring lytic transglycosylase RlpA family protein [Cyanobacteria bacterium SZAS LIN-3]|nr:septal ring lytic transglycosylase RlpA family protein [Cyanobacteria bacterium SZAS LIN-3]
MAKQTQILLSILLLQTTSAAQAQAPYTNPATTLTGDKQNRQLSGIASWYGHPFHGRRTASGQIYDMNKLTAAHLTLPLATEVLVENKRNGKKVVITVTDRGPYIKNRVLDLSRAAAQKLGMLKSGLAFVTYQVMSPQLQPPPLKLVCSSPRTNLRSH